jgi:hypothetical protein
MYPYFHLTIAQQRAEALASDVALRKRATALARTRRDRRSPRARSLLICAMVVLLVACAAATAPSIASARPAVQADHACYRPGDDLALTGSAFTADAEVAFIFDMSGKNGRNLLFSDPNPRTDAAGGVRATYRVPELASSDDRREQLFITANDQAKFGPDGPIGPPEESFANVTTQLSQWDVLADSWLDGQGDPQRAMHIEAFGWTHEKALWAHYFRGTKRIKTVRIGALQGACGDLTKRVRQFPFRPVAAGSWTIYFSGSQFFDKSKPWIRFPRVRVPVGKAVS